MASGYHRIVVGVDGSPHSRRAVAFVARLAPPRGGRVTCVRVIEPMRLPSMPFVPYLGFLNTTWFCPGVPIIADGLGGSVTVVNPSDTPLTGHLTVFTDATV